MSWHDSLRDPFSDTQYADRLPRYAGGRPTVGRDEPMISLVSLVYIGPLTLPIHGNSIATKVLAQRLAARGVELDTIDISEGAGGKKTGQWLRKLRGHLLAIAKIGRRPSPVYMSVNANGGMWLTTLVALFARILGRRLLLHHHSYDYVRKPRVRMAALASAAGPRAVHIVLGQRMADQLAKATPGIGRTLVLNNAGVIAPALLQIAPVGAGSVVIGHLSNLTAEKGVADAVRVAVAVRKRGVECRLILAGPAKDLEARETIARAEAEMGVAFEYRGPVYDDAKLRFFSDITHFVFPTRYDHEASPLVLFEAMAADVPCVATARACIPDDLGIGGGLAVEEAADFVSEAAAFICAPSVRGAARERFRELLHENTRQVDGLVALLSGDV